MKTLKALVRDGRWDEAHRRLRELALAADGYSAFNALGRVHARLLAAEPSSDRTGTVKVALLGVGTTDMIAPSLGLALEVRGIECAIHRADYGTYAREMLDPASDTVRFDPDVAVVVNSPMSLPARPVPGQDPAELEALVERVVDHWLDLCRSLHAHAGCEIVLDNFHPLPLRPLGNLAAKTPWDTNTFLRRVNLGLGARAPAFVHINDVESLSAHCGLARWFDARLWYHAKLPVAPESLPAYAKNTARVIAAIYGHSAKCLVLDLDNTLWGGVIGDDGLAGIRLGQGDAEGEAFLAFQEYILELKNRGVLLAVASKNNEETALEVFEKHPEMRIQRDDIVSFHANWDPKPGSLRAIARELNIGLDALVFADDNPRERDIVRQWLPEVRVVELSEEVADFPRLLDDTGWFETVRISAEDRTKTEQYRANTARAELQESGGGDYDAYLRSLAQVGVVAPYEAEHLDRIAQLVNKSNQFNLTTRRQTRAEVEMEMRDPARVTATVRLADRFGDNGLICVFSSLREGSHLEIDQWLMSCRVLHRSVEQLLLNWVVEKARALGLEEIRGTFIPTEKNPLVRDHYASLGFDPLGDERAEVGTTRWRLALDDFSPFDVSIDLTEAY